MQEDDFENAVLALEKITQNREENSSVKYVGDSDSESRQSISNARRVEKRSKSPNSTHSILDPENPGPWLLFLHKENLVWKLKQPKVNFATQLYNKFSQKVSDNDGLNE